MVSQRVAIAAFFVGILLLTANSHTSQPDATPSAFRLPVLSGVRVQVTQGNNQGDHIAANGSEYAFDFIVGQTNFVIAAAQGGTIIGMNNTSTIQCSGLNTEIAPESKTLPHCWAYANYVLIADDDGKTAALYVHLLPFSSTGQMPKVTLGEHVNQGDPIGLAGTTGWSSGVHLHFQVESLPSSESQKSQKPLGWWWTNSLPTTFSNPEVFAKDACLSTPSNGIPQTGQCFVVSKPASVIKPGGLWISPKDGQVVSGDKIHFAAYAYPTHPSDPAIDHVNFTINVQGVWKLACPPVPPPSTTPAPAPIPVPPSIPANAQEYSCDANLKALGVPYGHIQVSFDVYDTAGNVNLAPNGVHMLTYKPSPPKLIASPTYINIFQQYQGGGICAHTNSQDGYICTILLSSPSSNQVNINWSAISSDCSDVCFNPTPSSGTLSPGQQINVVVNFGCAGIQNGIDRRESITFTGGVNPVVVQLICE